MRGVWKLALTLALAVLIAAMLAACGGDDSDGSGTGSTTATAPESAGGSSSEGSASFRVPGGDNSIQNYGEEADSAEREEAATAVTEFLEAREKGDWQGLCDNLAEAAVAPLEGLAEKEGGCAATLAAFIGAAPASTRANPLTAAGVASLRIEGDRGFVLFHGAGGTDYFIPMIKEGGEWKVGAISPSELS